MMARTPANRHAKNARNKTLAVVLLCSGGLLFLSMLIGLYFVSERTILIIDSINLKLLLAIVGSAVISAIGALIFLIFHDPTAKRLVVRSWQGIFVMSVMGTGFSFFGLPRLEALTVNSEVGLNVDFSTAEVVRDISPILLVCFSAILAISILYTIICIVESKYDTEL